MKIAFILIALLGIGVAACEPVSFDFSRTNGNQQEPAAEQMAGLFDFQGTQLAPEDELMFQLWKRQWAPRDSGTDYDLRGAFKSGFKPDLKTRHWPDTYKLPNHPTFSDQSIYAKRFPYMAGHWNGDTYVPGFVRQLLGR